MGLGDERNDGGYRGPRRHPGDPKPGIEEVRRRVAEKAAAARRTRLYYFGLAGGRR